MADTKQGRRSFGKWLSEKFLHTQDTKAEAREVKEKSGEIADATLDEFNLQFEPKEPTEVSSGTEVQEHPGTPDININGEPIAEDELSVELQQLLQGKRFELLRKVLKEEKVTTLDQFKSINLWTFLNLHNLYPITKRLSVFDYIQDQLHLKSEMKDEPDEDDVVEELEPEQEAESIDMADKPEDFLRDKENNEVVYKMVAETEIKTEPGSELEIEHELEPEAETLPRYKALPAVGKLRLQKAAASKPYYEIYLLDPDRYRSRGVRKCGFSTRVITRLMDNKIKNVGTLLEQSDAVMLAINGFGKNSLKELHAYFDKLARTGSNGLRHTNSIHNQSNELIQKRGNHQKRYSAIVEAQEAMAVTDKPSPQIEPASIPYCEIYQLDPDLYRTYPIMECGFSARVSNRLMGNKIESVGTLLEQTDAFMLSISSFGQNSLKELHAYFEKLARSGAKELYPIIPIHNLTNELTPYSRNLQSGDFTFTEDRRFSAKSMRIIHQLKEVHKLVDPGFIEGVTHGEPAAIAIIEMLKEFVVECEREKACKAALEKIPQMRVNMPAEAVFRAYTNSEELRTFFEQHNNKGATLQQFVYANADLIVDNNIQLARFLKWCGFNIVSETDEFFDKQFENERIRRVFWGRVRGDTLAQLGEELGITRERVRQIEAAFVKKARTWFRRNRNIYKIFLDLGEKTSMSPIRITNYIGQYGLETVALLKESSGKDYFYDERFDLFTIGEPSDFGLMQQYVDSLPDIFAAGKMDSFIMEGVNKYGYPEDQLRIVFNGSYRRTGNTYHRSKLTLASVYGEAMKKYYPNGIHIDSEEINRFQKIIKDEFGIDLMDKNIHSISSIISRIGILCGRGRYRLKSEGPYLSEKLTKQIQTYVENSTIPIVLLKTIFVEFEDDLRAEGVNNRYYLQGILKELFGDVWYFRKDSVSTDPEATSFTEAVVKFIAKATSPVSKEVLMHQFPGITDIVINLAVSSSDTINLFGSYINASRLTLSDGDVQFFREKLEDALSADEICYVRDLYNAIRVERPGLLSRNFITAGFGLYSVLEYLFGDDYNFSRPFIAREGAEIKSILSVLKEMVMEAELIEISEITSFASEHNYPIPSILDFADSCNGTHLMINAQELATFEYTGVNKDIARQVEQLVKAEVSEAVPISQLTCAVQLPQINVEWNAWLIYSILKKWSTDLEVGTSKSLFKIAYPVVAPAGTSLEVEFDESISHNGELISTDNLENIEDLIADYISEELEDIDEL